MMYRKIFRPKPGQVPGRFQAYRLNGAANYRGDVVFLDTTAPTIQGASGVVDGLTMTDKQDFFYVKSASIATGAVTTPNFAVAGVIEGRSVGDRNTTTALDDDGIVIVQVAGVHPQVWTTSNAGAVDGLLFANSANTLGSGVVGVGLDVATAAANLAAGLSNSAFVVGVILEANTVTAARGGVTTANYNPIWIRCGDVN